MPKNNYSSRTYLAITILILNIVLFYLVLRSDDSRTLFIILATSIVLLFFSIAQIGTHAYKTQNIPHDPLSKLEIYIKNLKLLHNHWYFITWVLVYIVASFLLAGVFILFIYSTWFYGIFTFFMFFLGTFLVHRFRHKKAQRSEMTVTYFKLRDVFREVSQKIEHGVIEGEYLGQLAEAKFILEKVKRIVKYRY